MAYINAKNHNWNLDTDLKFEVIQNLDGAIRALTDNRADYFMWERFTTKPIVDDGIFKHVGNCPTPWPCFVIVARDEFIKSNEDDLKTILDIINKTTKDFKAIPNIDNTIAKRYEQELEDVRKWLALTEWSQSQIEESTLQMVQKELFELNIISKKVNYNSLIHNVQGS
jgi:ABC-type nitrate/sulfonate/bicarbonate transport system substrate-binding protein